MKNEMLKRAAAFFARENVRAEALALLGVLRGFALLTARHHERTLSRITVSGTGDAHDRIPCGRPNHGMYWHPIQVKQA